MEHTLQLEMDYSLGVDELLKQLRKNKKANFAWSAGEVSSKNFPLDSSRTGKKRVRMPLLHFNQLMRSHEVKKSTEARSYRPVNIHELLSVAVRWPSLATEFPMPAASSVWHDPATPGEGFVPYLCGNPSTGLMVGLWNSEHEWKADCRFLAVPAEKRTGPTWVIVP